MKVFRLGPGEAGTVPEALQFGIDEQRREVMAIANNPAAPTFANTVEALERAGERLGPRALNLRSHDVEHDQPAISGAAKGMGAEIVGCFRRDHAQSEALSAHQSGL
jgi:Zn-dependent oligopeptidase